MRYLALLFLLLSSHAYSSTIYYWTANVVPYSTRYASAELACKAYHPNATYQSIYSNYGNCLNLSGGVYGTTTQSSQSCQYGNTGLQCNASCNSPNYMSGGQCVAPPTCNAANGETFDDVTKTCVVTNPCISKKGTSTPYFEKFPSFEQYQSNCKVSVNGCQVDVCANASATAECGTNGETGEFACWGSGSFTGEKSEGTNDRTAQSEQPPKPEPTETGSSQSCTAPSVNNGTTSYTCNTEAWATEHGSSNCAVGEVNGVKALHCTKPDYVPEHDKTTRQDEISETVNADGGKTTTNNSTTTNTHCSAGSCNTTTNNSSTTTTTDGNGKTTGSSTTCTGDNCDNPTTPGNESEEGEEGGMPGQPSTPDTSDAMPQIGDGDAPPEYSESLNDFVSRIKGSPLLDAVGSIEVPSGGSCSIGSANIFGGSVSFNIFCEKAPEVLGGLRYLFLAIWAWAAIRLFLTA